MAGKLGGNGQIQEGIDGVVGDVDQFHAVLCRQGLQLSQCAVLCAQHRAGQGLQTAAEICDSLLQEQLRSIFGMEGIAAVLLGQFRPKIHAGGAGGQGDVLQRLAVQGKGGGIDGTLGENDLEQGALGQGTLQPQGGDDLLQADLLVVQQIVDLGADTGQIILHGGIPTGLQAQRQSVDEGAAHSAGLGEETACGGRADQNVVLAGQAGHQQAKYAQEEHIGGDTLLGAECVTGIGQFPTEREGHGIAQEIEFVAAGEVAGDVQRIGQSGKMLLPIVHPALRVLLLGQMPGIIQIVEGLCGQTAALIQGIQFGQQDGGGQTVADDMVNVHQQDPIAGSLFPQTAAQQGGLIQLEGDHQRFGGLFQVCTLQNGQHKVRLSLDSGKNAVGLREEGGAQKGFVCDQIPESLLQTGNVGRGGEAECACHEIGLSGGIQMGLDVNALLDGGKGPALQRGSGQQPLDGENGDAALAVQKGRKAQNAAAGVEIGHPQGAAGLLGDLAKGLHGVEGVAAEQEIVAVHAQVGTTQNPAENSQQGLLQLSLGLHLGAGSQIGMGQQGLVDLAVGGEGDLLQAHDGGGDHVVRQITGAQVPQFILGNGKFGGVEGQQDVLTAVLLNAGGGLAHLRMSGQALGHFLGLHAQTAQFYLTVGAAGQHDLAVGSPAGQVAGLIETVAQFEGAFGETAGGQFGGVAIAAAHADTAHIQIAVNTDGQRVAPVVQNVEFAVGHGPAGGDGGGVVELLDADGHCGLGGAVLIIDTGGSVQPQTLEQIAGECLTAADDALHAGHSLTEGLVLQKCGHTGGSRGQEADTIAADQLGEGLRRLQLLVLRQQNGTAVEHGADTLQQEGVKTHAAYGQNGALAVDGLHGAGQIQQRTAGNFHALGGTGGAGSIHHICQSLGAVLGRGALNGRGEAGDVDDGKQVGEVAAQLRCGQQDRRTALSQNFTDAVFGLIGGEQEESAACPQNAHHRTEQFRHAGQQNGHQRVGSGTDAGQCGVDPGGIGLQLLIGGALSVVDQGHPVGSLLTLAGEAVIQTGIENGMGGAVEGVEDHLPLFMAENGQLTDGTVGGGQGLTQNVDQTVVQGVDLLIGEELGEIIVIHGIASIILQIAQMDAQLLHLITAVVPAAGEGHGGILAGLKLTVLIGECDVEQTVSLVGVLLGQFADIIQREALMAEHIKPLDVQMVAELVEGPVSGDLAEEGQGADKHTAGLLVHKVLAVEDGDTDGKAVGAADAFEVDGQRQIEHGKRRNTPAHTECVNIVIQILGQREGESVAHIAQSRAAHGLEGGGLTGLLQNVVPIGLVLGVGGGGKIALLVFQMGDVRGDITQFRFASGQQIQITLADPVAHQNLSPAVRDQMVHLDDQTTGVFTGVEQDKTVQGAVQQGHGLPGERLLPALDTLLGGLGKVIDGDRLMLIGGLILHRSLVHHGDLCAQRGVCRQHEIDTALKGGKIHSALNMQCGTDVIDGGVRTGTLYVPNILLAERERISLPGSIVSLAQREDHLSGKR